MARWSEPAQTREWSYQGFNGSKWAEYSRDEEFGIYGRVFLGRLSEKDAKAVVAALNEAYRLGRRDQEVA